jgi:hypothetical protein
VRIRRCSSCRQEKPLGSFHSKRADCKPCQREYMRKYQATYRGACRHTYNQIRRRCSGRATASSLRSGWGAASSICIGLPFCTWDDFWHWAQQPMQIAEWNACIAEWRRSGAPKDRPSIDRLSAHVDVGYVPWNMRWCSVSNKSIKTNIQRWHGRHACWPDYEKEEMA